jgi:hypothetical protein
MAQTERRRAQADRAKYEADPLRKKLTDLRSKYGERAVIAYQAVHACEASGDPVSGKRKHVDHDHSFPRRDPRAFRGVLCGACNCALGYLKEEPRRIAALATYLLTREVEKDR